jgi:hypothetical protein
MTIKKIEEAVDMAIRFSETDDNAGYSTGGRTYECYMSKERWKEFVKEMKENYPQHYERYASGKGGELSEKNNRPPKMASYGSSSRFVYNTLRDVPNIEFEKDCPKRFARGCNPQLDAYVKIGGTSIFVEAKCHEIYNDKHLGSKSYEKVYKRLGSGFKYNEETSVISCNGMEIRHIEAKQLICHLLAIAAGILEGRCEPNARLVYLIFNPTKDDVAVHIHDEWKGRVEEVYNRAISELESICQVKGLFDNIYEFQRENLSRRGLVKYSGEYSFELCIADQESWKPFFK